MASLKSLRYEKGWTQTELAINANVPQSTISKIEAGNTQTASPKAMKRIADALEVKVNEVDEFSSKIEGKDDLPPAINEREALSAGLVAITH